MTNLQLQHVGVVVRDLERSLGFYRDLLGLRVLDSGVAEGKDLETLLAAPGVRLAYAELDLGRGQVLELLQSLGGGVAAPMPGEQSPPAGAAAHCPPGAPLRPGMAHLAIEVNDIDELVSRFEAAHVTVRSDPVVLQEEGRWHGVKAVYSQDPDGMLVELCQLPRQAASRGEPHQSTAIHEENT